jgi:hypothetical protein
MFTYNNIVIHPFVYISCLSLHKCDLFIFYRPVRLNSFPFFDKNVFVFGQLSQKPEDLKSNLVDMQCAFHLFLQPLSKHFSLR